MSDASNQENADVANRPEKTLQEHAAEFVTAADDLFDRANLVKPEYRKDEEDEKKGIELNSSELPKASDTSQETLSTEESGEYNIAGSMQRGSAKYIIVRGREMGETSRPGGTLSQYWIQKEVKPQGSATTHPFVTVVDARSNGSATIDERSPKGSVENAADVIRHLQEAVTAAEARQAQAPQPTQGKP